MTLTGPASAGAPTPRLCRRLGVALVVGAVFGGAPASAATAATSAPGSDAPVDRDRVWWAASMGIDRAREVAAGQGVKVCLPDTGVDVSHPDLAGVNFKDGVDLGGSSSMGLAPTGSPHGTAMAAYLAGNGSGPGRGRGIIGAAPQATIISVSAPNVDRQFTAADQLQSLMYCVEAGAQVVSLSQSSNNNNDAVIELAERHDVLIVAGAGNFGANRFGSWAQSFGVLQVGGVDQDLTPDPMSASKRDFRGQGVALCGPYGDVPNQGIVGAVPGGGYVPEGGTSAATAVVAGVAAAVRAKFPELKAGDVINRLLKTAKKAGTGDVPTPECGWGIADAYAALTADVPAGNGSNPLGWMQLGKKVEGRALTNVGSMGLWDPTAKIVDDLGYRPTPMPTLKFYPPGRTPSPDTSSSGTGMGTVSAPATIAAGPAPSSSEGGSVPWAWVAGLGVAALAVVGGGVAWMMRRGQRS